MGLKLTSSLLSVHADVTGFDRMTSIHSNHSPAQMAPVSHDTLLTHLLSAFFDLFRVSTDLLYHTDSFHCSPCHGLLLSVSFEESAEWEESARGDGGLMV